eukprot:TRINITY_DN39806_c0_g1_i1.p1 TRINITY_DN39806_c0_g1~~TRINITY_DN39806_c0_g1_i1.p1  ORF type:complete len:359 (+),score=84.86 TRINITY_DN39806_c0_g1_i1:149-1225(+)
MCIRDRRQPGRDICGKYKTTGECPAFQPGGNFHCAFDHPPEIVRMIQAGIPTDQLAATEPVDQPTPSGREQTKECALEREAQGRAMMADVKDQKRRVISEEQDRRQGMMDREKKALEEMEAKKIQAADERRAQREAHKLHKQVRDREREAQAAEARARTKAEAAAHAQAEASRMAAAEERFNKNMSQDLEKARQSTVKEIDGFGSNQSRREAELMVERERDASMLHKERVGLREETSLRQHRDRPASVAQAEALALAEARSIEQEEIRGDSKSNDCVLTPPTIPISVTSAHDQDQARFARAQRQVWKGVEEDDCDLVRLGVRSGADLNQGAPAMMALTPLHLAAHLGRTTVIKCLLQY